MIGGRARIRRGLVALVPLVALACLGLAGPGMPAAAAAPPANSVVPFGTTAVGANAVAGPNAPIVGLAATSDAAVKGLRKGDVLVRAGDRDVGAASDFAAVVDAAKKAGRASVLIGVNRGGLTLFTPLKVSG